MRFIDVFLIVVFLIANNYLSVAQKQWEETRYEDGIKVYERESGNRLNDIKLQFNVASGMDGVISFLLNKEGYHDLIDNIKKVKFIKELNDSTRFYFINIGVEPFINRDAVVKVVFAREGEKVVTNKMILDNSINYDIEHTSVLPFKILWKFTLVDHSVEVELVYSAQIDDYNDFVYAIVEELLKDQLFGMAKKMQRNIVKPIYQEPANNIW
jgi:hypothetical protein